MLKMFYRMRSRKGFTIVELIIVIAIIGVLTALILPSLLYDRKPVTGKAMAKAFFYETQDIVSSLKIANRPGFEEICSGGTGVPATDDAVCFYVKIDAQGHVRETGTIDWKNSGSMQTMADTITAAAWSDAAKRVLYKMERAFNAYTTSSNENMTGVLYALVDSKARVRAAYWTDDLEINGLTVHNTAHFKYNTQLDSNKDNLFADGYYCSAYPERLSKAGAKIYNYTAI